MLIKTIKPYSDKFTKVAYDVNSIRDVEDARAKELIKKGFAEKVNKKDIADEPTTKEETPVVETPAEETTEVEETPVEDAPVENTEAENK